MPLFYYSIVSPSNHISYRDKSMSSFQIIATPPTSGFTNLNSGVPSSDLKIFFQLI